MRVDPSLVSVLYSNPRNQEYKEYAINCDETVPTDPGGKVTYVETGNSMPLMLSVPVGTTVTFWVVLYVEQQEPIPISADGSDYINLTIDELRVIVLTSF